MIRLMFWYLVVNWFWIAVLCLRFGNRVLVSILLMHVPVRIRYAMTCKVIRVSPMVEWLII